MNEVELLNNQMKMEEVVGLYAKGYKITDIQKKTGSTRADIDRYLADFRQYALQDPILRERAREVVTVVDIHYSDLITEMYSAIKEADAAGDYKVKLTGLKSIADVQAKRVELLQKAGLVAENAMVDQIVESERKQNALMDILREVTSKCDNCKMEVSRRLSKVTNKTEVVVA